MSFKYKTRLDGISFACHKLGDRDFPLLSKASLDELKKLSPNIDVENNPDLLGVSFNLAVPNMINNNGDGISGATASKIAKRFLHKYLNIEHNKKRVVGHITNYSFNDFKDNKFMSDDEAAQTLDPIYLSVAGVIYRTVDKSFTSLMLRNSDKNDKFNNAISASWEIGFSSYYLAVGSQSLKEAEIVTDAAQVQELSQFLKAKGGSGKMNDGTPIYRLIVGEIYPLGGGFTTNPAAQVNGVVAFDNDASISLKDSEDDKEDDKEEENQDIETEKSSADFQQEVAAFLTNKKSNSISVIKNVKNINHMDLEKLISELKSALLEKKFGEEAVASMTSQFVDAIKQKDAEYRESLSAEKNAKEQAEKLYKETVASVENIKSELSKTQEELNQIKKVQAEEQALARQNARVAELDSAFDLSDEDRKLVIGEVQALDASEEAFASYKEKFNVVWKHKNKEAIKAQQAEIEKKISEQVEARLKEVSKASTVTAEVKVEEQKPDVDAALESAKATNTAPDSKISGEPSLREKFAKAFSRENISVSYSK
jgi:hypothetical protein